MTITSQRSTAPRARLTTQGQITVPKVVRDRMGIRPGDELEFDRVGDDYVVRPRRRRSILEFAGIAARSSARIPTTAAELDRLIDEGMAVDAARRQQVSRRAPRAG